MASIYKRGDIWWVKYSHFGKVVRQSLQTKRKIFAKKMLIQIEADILQQKVPFLLVNKCTLGELAELIIKDYKYKGQHVNTMKTQVKKLLNFFGNDRPAGSITTSALDELIEMMEFEEYKNGSINRYLAAIKRMYKLGIEHEPQLVSKVPKITFLKEDNVRTGFFETEDYLKLHSAIDPFLKDFVATGFETGMRDDEMKKLEWYMVDRLTWSIKLPGHVTKNGRPRLIPLSHELSSRLKNRWDYKEKNNIQLPYVFLNSSESGSLKDIRRIWNQACCDQGLGYGYAFSKKYVGDWKKKLPSGPTVHDFRRTAVRNYVRAGVSIDVAMAIVGHLTTSTFSRYNIVNEDDLRLATKKKEKYIQKQIDEVKK